MALRLITGEPDVGLRYPIHTPLCTLELLTLDLLLLAFPASERGEVQKDGNSIFEIQNFEYALGGR